MKKILLLFSIMLCVTSAVAQVMPMAGYYTCQKGDGSKGEVYVAANEKGQIYFDASSVTASGNMASLHPDNNAWVHMTGNKASYTKRFDDCTYTVTLTFDLQQGTLTVTENYSKWAPIFGEGASLAGTYRKSPDVIGDTRGYLYSYMSDGTLGVNRGGNYCGTVRIPETVIVPDKRELTVTTVRKNAMSKPSYETSTKPLRSVVLPATVTLVGVDAFYGNEPLESIAYGNPNSVYVESGAYMACPNLQLPNGEPPVFGYCEFATENREKAFSRFMYTIGERVTGAVLGKYKWACFKHWHNRIGNPIANNIGKEDGMGECFAVWNKVKGYIYSLRDPKQGPNMFWGYDPVEAKVVMVDNNYMGTHKFPQYNRWKWGEEKEAKSTYFTNKMQKRYGRNVMYSYVAASLREDGRNVSVTEFEITDNEALVVIAWSRADDIICTWEKRMKIEGEGGSVWNVDDDGTYGIPEVLCISEDNYGNVELFLNHQAPESINLMHLVRKGETMEMQNEAQWYVWYD